MYTGSTKNLINRVKEHRKGYQKGFTQKYNVNRLVYCEAFEHIDMTKDREKQIKGLKRQRKIELIEAKNKLWNDLYEDLVRDPSLRSGFRDRKNPDPSTKYLANIIFFFLLFLIGFSKSGSSQEPDA